MFNNPCSDLSWHAEEEYAPVVVTVCVVALLKEGDHQGILPILLNRSSIPDCYHDVIQGSLHTNATVPQQFTWEIISVQRLSWSLVLPQHIHPEPATRMGWLLLLMFEARQTHTYSHANTNRQKHPSVLFSPSQTTRYSDGDQSLHTRGSVELQSGSGNHTVPRRQSRAWGEVR